METKSIKPYGNVVLLAVIWSAYYAAVGVANKVLNPIVTGVFVRVFVFVLLTVVMAAKHTLADLKCDKKALPFLVLIGIMGFSLDITAFIGLRYASAGTGTVLLKTDIIFVSLASALIFKEKIDKLDWLFIVTMLAGVMLVMGINPFHLAFQVTDLFFIASAVCVSTNAFLIKHVQKIGKKPVSNDVIAYYNNGIAMIVFLVFLPILTKKGDISRIFSDKSILIALVIGGIGQFFIYVVYYKSLRQLPVWIVKTILLLIPVFAMVYDVIIWRQMPTVSHLIGTLITIGSAVMILWRQQPKPLRSK